MRERGWDSSASVTHGLYRKTILEVLGRLDETVWEDIGLGHSGTLIRTVARLVRSDRHPRARRSRFARK